MAANVPPLGEVANFVTVYFPLKIKFLAERKRELTTKSAILQNRCYMLLVFSRNYDFNRKILKFLLPNSNFHTSVFRFAIFNVFFLLFIYRVKKRCRKFQVSVLDSNFHASAFQGSTFQVSSVRFQLLRFCFSSFRCQNSTFKPQCVTLYKPLFKLFPSASFRHK